MHKALCPTCGTTNTRRVTPFSRCAKCRRRLPFTLPRQVIYAVRTLWRPLVIVALVAAAVTLAPAYKQFRENQKIPIHN